MPKEPWVAVIFSLMLPGLGHAYAGRAKRGLVLFCAGAILEISLIAYAIYPSTRIGLPFILAAAALSIAFALHVLTDAYRSAKAWNVQHDVPRRPWWSRTLLIAAALLLLWFLNPMEHGARYLIENVVQAFEIQMHSMEPTLLPDDRVLVDKRFYRSHEPRRGDVIVFRYPLSPDKQYLKRIVGLPGDRVEIRSGRLHINGRELVEVYVNGTPVGGYDPATIPANAYFVLGDNRNNSEDSRSFGPISRESLLGKVTKIYYPFDRSGPVE
jgi:signal peptidase I